MLARLAVTEHCIAHRVLPGTWRSCCRSVSCFWFCGHAVVASAASGSVASMDGATTACENQADVVHCNRGLGDFVFNQSSAVMEDIHALQFLSLHHQSYNTDVRRRGHDLQNVTSVMQHIFSNAACMQVADANSEHRGQLCLKYFSLFKQLGDNDLSTAVRADLQQQLDDIVLQTQSRSAMLLTHVFLLPTDIYIHTQTMVKRKVCGTTLVMLSHA